LATSESFCNQTLGNRPLKAPRIPQNKSMLLPVHIHLNTVVWYIHTADMTKLQPISDSEHAV